MSNQANRDSDASHCSVASIYKALDKVSEQIARAEALLKTWPHAQSERAVVETPIGVLRYERPYLVVVDQDSYVRSTELPAAWRITVAKSIPQLIGVCESIADDFLSETEAVAESLRRCLDDVE